MTREQLATLKASADALERGNLDDPVRTHAPFRPVNYGRHRPLAGFSRRFVQEFHAMVDQALSSASSVVGTADVAAKLAREQRLNKLA